MNENENGLAYSCLRELLEDWGSEYPELVKRPDRLAKQAADVIFNEFLDIDDSEIDNEG